MLAVGDLAPAFDLESDSAGRVSSQALAGRRYVLYFYPKDDTPGCSKEACSFRDRQPDFTALGVPVYGVSADDLASHAKFTRKYQLNFPLLADPEHRLLEAYGVWVEKSMYGKKYMGVQRATFVIGADGRIEQVWEKVKPEGHADQVYAYLTAADPRPAATADTPRPRARASSRRGSDAATSGAKSGARRAATKGGGTQARRVRPKA